jgi:xylulokinase
VIKDFVIGVDSSTTSCKAIAWDAQGRALAEGRGGPFAMLSPEPNFYEQHAEEWWRALCVALKDLGSKIDFAQARAICLTHQRETFVPVDENGKPLRNGITWLDERSRDQLKTIQDKVGAEALHRITGKALSITPSLSKILWLMAHEPESIARAYKILDVHGFLVHRLIGEFKTSVACADPMGLVDMQKGRWADALMRQLGLDEMQFATLVRPGEGMGEVTAQASSATGLPVGLPVVAAAGDGQCAGLGANALGKTRAYLNLGTAVIGGFYSPTYLTDSWYRTMAAPLPQGYFLENVLKGGVFTVGWFVDKFASDLKINPIGLSPEQQLEAAAAKVPPGSLGLLLVPYWSNVMTPYWDAAATGITIGWTGQHGREHFYRAIMEGIAFEQRLTGDGTMRNLGYRVNEYVTMGGGSKSNLWCQIVADVTGVDVVRSTSVEATCLGAGILAATAAGWYANAMQAAETMTGTSERFSPNPVTQKIYDEYFEVYRDVFPAVRESVNKLTNVKLQGIESSAHARLQSPHPNQT